MFGTVSAANAGLLDRMYFDNLVITAESDARFWHEQTQEDLSIYTPGRTILDGKGHIYMPWTVYANGADLNSGRFVGQLVRLNETDGRRDPTFSLDPRIKRVAYATPAPDGEHMLLSVDMGNSTTVVRVDDSPISVGKPGPMYRQFLAAWSARVGVDIAAQAREFATR